MTLDDEFTVEWLNSEEIEVDGESEEQYLEKENETSVDGVDLECFPNVPMEEYYFCPWEPLKSEIKN